MGAGEHQTLSSSILKGMIQNPSLEQVQLEGCDFKGKFYNFMYCLWISEVSSAMRIMYMQDITKKMF